MTLDSLGGAEDAYSFVNPFHDALSFTFYDPLTPDTPWLATMIVNVSARQTVPCNDCVAPAADFKAHPPLIVAGKIGPSSGLLFTLGFFGPGDPSELWRDERSRRS
jgi:hypothetical protein